MKNHKNYITNLLFPALIYSVLTGALVGVCIVLFKFCASHVMTWSEMTYDFLKSNLWYYIPAAAVLFGAAFLYHMVYQYHPNIRGGGIPTSIGILRGLISFRWLYNLIGVFSLSMLTFFIGVPLGTEGPSVQIGTALGRGVTRLTTQKHAAWDRYIMTGGACAGFCSATDAPISGMMFAIEEAHQRISPMIILVSAISVTAAKIVSTVLAPLFGVNTYLFAPMHLIHLETTDLWLPVLIAVTVGLFAVVFLKYYAVLRAFWKKYVTKLPSIVRIFGVLLLTLSFGLLSQDFLFSGHHMIEALIHGHIAWYLLFVFVIIRASLMIFANCSGITGGMFLPIMALGAMISSIIGGFLITHTPLTAGYYSVVVVLGITACIASMMKMPLTAIVFAVEALSAWENIVPVMIASILSYFITEVFEVASINDHVLEGRLEDIRKGNAPVMVDQYVTVQENTFAVGKQVRDIFWPANLFVLSVQHPAERSAEMNGHGDNTLQAGDSLHVCYSTYDEKETRRELFAIVGTQKNT